MLLNILQNPQENACARVSFLIKLQGNFIKKETLAQVFSCEFFEISKNTFFIEHLWVTVSRSTLLKEKFFLNKQDNPIAAIVTFCNNCQISLDENIEPNQQVFASRWHAYFRRWKKKILYSNFECVKKLNKVLLLGVKLKGSSEKWEPCS